MSLRLTVIGGILLAMAGFAYGLGSSSAHPMAEPHKQLFDGRWYHQVQGGDYDSWMTLSVSPMRFECLDTQVACQQRWALPFQQAIDEWNSQPTTIEYDVRPAQSFSHDVNIGAVFAIADDIEILGVSLPLDANYQACLLGDCTYAYELIAVGDFAHQLFSLTTADRQATIAHELGHGLSLRHESQGYPCGQDVTGSIPHSIMAYNCIDPPSEGGRGETYIHSWDVCGVNHAYYDPSIGYAGCSSGSIPTARPPAAATNTPRPPSTPTPTPTPRPLLGTGSISMNRYASTLVFADHIPPPGLGAWTIDVTHDPSKLSIIGCAAYQGGVCNHDFSSTSARITGASATGVSGKNGLAVLSISCVQPGTSVLTLNIVLLVDATVGNPRPVSASTQNGTITCGTGEMSGDVDCSGRVNPVDATFVLQRLAGMIAALPCPENGDASGDNQTNVVDATAILQFASGMVASLPLNSS